MRVRDGLLWFSAVALSLLAHGMLFFNTGSLAGNQEQRQQERHATRVSFRSAAASQNTPHAVPMEVPPEEPEPEVTEAPEPPSEAAPREPKKRAERAREIERQPSLEPAPQTPSTQTSAAADKVPVVTEAVSGTIEDPALIEQAKQEYLRRLMAHIDKYKHYPRAARRRFLEGDVRVSFALQAGGQVADLNVEGEQGILSGAAQSAVEQAQPLPLPPATLVLPWPVTFTMRFSLN